MAEKVRELTEAQRNMIARTLGDWVKSHPHPDSPIIQLGDQSELSPRDIAKAAAEPNSPRGRTLLRVFAIGLTSDNAEPAETLEQILSDFVNDEKYWAARRAPARR
jgi:hypothetical protein